jgi:hypothetical protein
VFSTKNGGVCFDAAYATKKLGPRISIPLLLLIKLHTISGARGLTGPKFVLTCVKKALGVDLYGPFHLLI